MRIVTRTVSALKAFGRRFADNRRGNVAMMFALALPPMMLMTLGGVDIARVSTVRMNVQDALDAATLAAARSNAVSDADLKTIGIAALRANLANHPDITLRDDLTTFSLNSSSVVVADTRVDVKAIVANIFLPPYGQFFDDKLPANAHSEVNRSSQNVEVSLVLDTTGSMLGTKIADLKLAAKDLVDIVVQDQQTPWYSKVALVPYSMAVNPGSSAALAARGSYVSAPTTITAITWYSGTPKAVTAATRASPVVVTAAGHGFANGDKVVIWGQTGMTQINGRVFTVANKTSNTFQLSGVNGSAYNSFTTGGTLVAKCARSDCYPTVTSASHGISDGSYAYLSGITGMTQLNGQTIKTDLVSSNQFLLETVPYGTFGGAGEVTCRQAGCEYFAFINADGDLTTQKISDCVTERSGTNAYTDASPSTTRMGRNYPSSSNPCIANVIRPLSSDRTTIKSNIDSLSAGGSTGGHIGVGWGWYTVSPNFNSLWSSSGAAGAYTAANSANSTLKAVVIMTDGEYNSAYCNGVISLDSTNGSGATSTHINCNAPNGHPFDQTQALCAAMKAKGIIVYTVGFQVVDDQRARDLVNGCATDAAHVFLPNSGADLRQSFQAIGHDITNLRISR